MTVSPHYHLVPKDFDANLRFREMLLKEGSSDPKAAGQIRAMCAEDLLFYVNTFTWTFDPRKKGVEVTPFITYEEFQDEAMLDLARCIEVGQDAAVPKSRDMGASWMGLTVIEWFWHFREHQSFLLVSRNEDYVDKIDNPKALFWKLDFLLEHQPRWLLPSGWRRKKLSLVNEQTKSVIDGESTTGDAGRGDRRTAMFIDEHAAFDLDAGFKVLRATRDTTNCRIFNSTPQGASNAFYEVVHKTAAKILWLHWSKHPEKRLGLYTTDKNTGLVKLLDTFRGVVKVEAKGEDPKRVMFPDDYPFHLDKDDDKLRSPWYDNQCARCVSDQEVAQELDIDFLGSDYPFFDPKFIRLYKERFGRPPLSRGNLEYDRAELKVERFVEHKKGIFDLWIPLGNKDRPPKDVHYVIGVDISMGTGASNSVASVADRDSGVKVARLKTPNMRPWDFAGLVIALGRLFNDAFIAHDATGPTGATFTKRLLNEGYGNVYYRKSEDDAHQKVSTKPGYFLNAQARAFLLEQYRAALGELRFTNPSEEGLDECLQFIRHPDGGVEHAKSANTQDPGGAKSAHGDEVVADALASLGVGERQVEQEAEEPGEPEGSLAWRRKMRQQEAERSAEDRLSAGW